MTTDPFEHFRSVLVPQGTSDLVRLSLSGTAFFSHEFVLSVIRELETKARMVGMGMDSLTSMDQLVIAVIRDSSGWKPPIG